MNKRDIIFSLIIGEIIALFSLVILKVLDKALPFSWSLPIFLPFIFALVIYISFLISKKIPVFFQFARYIEVGILNTIIDFGILNSLIFITGFSSGIYYSLFKACSAAFAIINSFFWNKFWTFEKKEVKRTKEEATRFLLVTLSGAIINISIASFIVNIIGAPAGIDIKVWANVGAAIASVIGIAWNFLGYKFVVFKS